nr:MAG TPA: hypothetical protein [Caudoviricetes sp.]
MRYSSVDEVAGLTGYVMEAFPGATGLLTEMGRGE